MIVKYGPNDEFQEEVDEEELEAAAAIWDRVQSQGQIELHPSGAWSNVDPVATEAKTNQGGAS